MIDIISNIFVNLLVGHHLFVRVLRFITIFFIGVLIILEITYYREFDRLSFVGLFNRDILLFLYEQNKKIIAILGIINTLFFLFVYFRQEKKIKERKNCGLKKVALAEIAQIWLEREQLKENIKQEVLQQPLEAQEVKHDILFVDFKNQKTNQFFKQYILPYKDSLSNQGIEIIIDVLHILDDNIEVPSVVGYFDKDADSAYKKTNQLVTSNQTSYDILKNIPLIEHTFNVVKESIDILIKEHPKEFKLYLERAIIAALFHDVGKIKKLEEKLNGVTLDLFKTTSHEKISQIIFLENYPDYQNKAEVLEAIKDHHKSFKESENKILKTLIRADKEARKKEIDDYLIRLKTEKKEKELKQDIPDVQTSKKEIIEEVEKTEDDISNEEKIENEMKIEEFKTETKKEESKEEPQKLDLGIDLSIGFDNVEEKIENFQNNIQEFEFDFDDIWEEFREKIIETPCIVNKKGSSIDLFKFSIPFKDDMLFISKGLIQDYISDIIGVKIETEQVHSFIEEAKKRKIIGFVNTDRGFYTTQMNIVIKTPNNKTFTIKGYGVNFFIKKIGIAQNDFIDIKNECKNLEIIQSMELPNFKEE